MRYLILLAIALGFLGCTPPKKDLQTGIWRGVLSVQGHQLPFNFDVSRDSTGIKAYLHNGSERLLLDEVKVSGDSVFLTLHIFDASLRASMSDGMLTGYFVKQYEKNYRIPFHATFGDDFRFSKASTATVTDFSGTWAVTFASEKKSSPAVGIFRQKGNHAEGTFLNDDGDYRYLEGNIVGDTLWLSTFDGEHSFLFAAVKKDSQTLAGEYWSGKTGHKTWTGRRDAQAALTDSETITSLKKGFEKLEFAFPDLLGNKVSLSDERFRNKVVIVQVMGTWCPNCMDETKFLSKWYLENRGRGIEILGLAFERNNDFTYARERISKMKAKLGVEYPVIIAGSQRQADVAAALPELTPAPTFPTTIFIGKDGKVKRIHTGFSGPGTVIYFDQTIDRFNTIVNELLESQSTSTTK